MSRAPRTLRLSSGQRLEFTSVSGGTIRRGQNILGAGLDGHKIVSVRYGRRPNSPEAQPSHRARQALELHARGLSIPRIASELGVSRQAVWQVVRRWESRDWRSAGGT